MSIKCGSCLLSHETVKQVKACFSSPDSFPRDCIHGMVPLTCMSCRRRGGWSWSRVFKLEWASKCRFCAAWMEDGELARKRGSAIAHPGCVEDPARAQDPPTLYWLDGDALGIPDYVIQDTIASRWDDVIDTWLSQAVELELDTTWEMWEQIVGEIGDLECLSLLMDETTSPSPVDVVDGLTA